MLDCPAIDGFNLCTTHPTCLDRVRRIFHILSYGRLKGERTKTKTYVLDGINDDIAVFGKISEITGYLKRDVWEFLRNK
ncbi:MAG: hypothetical protein COT25_00945 [Candidatus Kerfeldbacteria bacterium CG08_land_8_20_14_0_20_42_7]|uniref:Uncharacterized protein n=1 Tax=Candidatus Kerfeldbacteria bacterium CG08_land_8_20_14_0_20_42_7 TaxID=2014245 RepID=A0A2H0YTK8_9BACT|nr:MAG: hypothetical protein COT25_00945 [Candidatus Kerfeldbacteria bacterium CG08_land_8_20_14_0_20_42_7]